MVKKETKSINKDKLDFLKTPPELKKYLNTLIGSLGLFGLIWGGGAYFNELSNKINNNKKDIDIIKVEFQSLKTDVIELNELNNNTLNGKLVIYLNHKDKEEIKNLLEMEDNKYKYESTKIFNNNYIKKPTN